MQLVARPQLQQVQGFARFYSRLQHLLQVESEAVLIVFDLPLQLQSELLSRTLSRSGRWRHVL
eukprot:scaffold7625_cov686-Prasinococcus_capsulatus_cf.AAC.1